MPSQENEAELKKLLPRYRAALTRAINAGDPKKILETANRALAKFDEIGYPDQWHRWQVARDDAMWAIQRQSRKDRYGL
jgi:predicted metalloendopeptidase